MFEIERQYNFDETYVKIAGQKFTPDCTYTLHNEGVYVGELFFCRFTAFLKIYNEYYKVSE